MEVNMKAKLLTTFVLAVLFMTVSVSAEEIDSVILTTSGHYPDSLVAGAVANNIGSPILLTSPGELDSETLAEIEELSPETIYIVGGPAAISEDVETSLSATYEVVRLWGMTRFGTNVEVVEYFWESAPRVMLVWDVLGLADAGNHEMLSDVKDLAIHEDIPVILVKKNEVPEGVVNSLVNLSVESVILVGNVGSGVTDTLEELGIEIEEEVKGEDAKKTRERVREKVKEKIKERTQRPLIVVAAGDWSDSIKAPYSPNGTSRHITSEEQIDDLITEIGDVNYSNIKIVGKQELAQAIYDRLTEEGIDAEIVSARKVAAVAVQIAKKELARIKVRESAVKTKLRNMFQRRVNAVETDADNLVEKTEMFITNSGLADDVKERWLNWLSEKKQSFDDKTASGDYTSAWKDYAALKAKISDLTFKYRTRLVNAYKDMRAKETQLRTVVATSLDKLKTVREKLSAASDSV